MARPFAPEVKILVNQRDVTGDFTPFLTSLSWTNKATAFADTLAIALEDRDGRWQGAWYPVKGSSIEAWLGYEGNLLYCGLFYIENIDIKGPPDVVDITACSVPADKPLRTKKHSSFAETTLPKIAAKIAADSGLKVVGDVPEISFKYVYQNSETDLAFLQRLALDYGAVFTVKGDMLIFHQYETMDRAGITAEIHKNSVASYEFSERSLQGAAASRYDSDVQAQMSAAQAGSCADSQTIETRAESQAQQEKRVASAMRLHKGEEFQAAIALEGDARLVAGCNVDLAGWGIMDGPMQIAEAVHTVDSSGYKTAITLGRIQ